MGDCSCFVGNRSCYCLGPCSSVRSLAAKQSEVAQARDPVEGCCCVVLFHSQVSFLAWFLVLSAQLSIGLWPCLSWDLRSIRLRFRLSRLSWMVRWGDIYTPLVQLSVTQGRDHAPPPPTTTATTTTGQQLMSEARTPASRVIPKEIRTYW